MRPILPPWPDASNDPHDPPDLESSRPIVVPWGPPPAAPRPPTDTVRVVIRRQPHATVSLTVSAATRDFIHQHVQHRAPWRPRLTRSAPMRLRWRLYGRVDRLRRAVPDGAMDSVSALLTWAAKRVATIPDAQLAWLDELLDQPVLASVALTSLECRQVVTTHGPPLEQLWPHWLWLTRLAGLDRREAPLGAQAVRQRLCPGLPARVFAAGWPAWLDVLTLHGLRHWAAPGLTALDRARLVDILWSCAETSLPPVAWHGGRARRAGVRQPVPGLDSLWQWLECLELDPVLELRQAGTEERDLPALDRGLWRDLFAQASLLEPGPRPRWPGPGRPTVRGWHDHLGELYRAQDSERRRERAERRAQHQHEAWQQLQATTPHWDFRADPGYAALTGAFLHVTVEPVWAPDELLAVSADMRNCAALYRRELACGQQVFLVGRDAQGRAQLLCQFGRHARLPAWDEPWIPLNLGTLRTREVKWAYNRSLDDHEQAAWIRWLADRGVHG